ELPVLLVVLDHQDKLTRHRLAPHRERERERRADAHFALQPDFAAVQLDEPPRERETEPRALVFLRRVGADLAELLEHRFLVLGRDADAAVGDADLDHVALQHRADAYTTALRRELYRV